MGDFAEYLKRLPVEQRAIREKCFHPTGIFVEFAKDEIEQSIPARFEKIVRQYPDRLAVTSGNHSLTYDGLNRAANRVGRAITALRGEASEPIALLFENGIDVIIAILGSLKAGKHFVILNPSFPFERTIGVLQHSQARLIVTAKGNLELAQKLMGDDRTLLNSDEIDVSLCSDDLGLALAPENLASLQYTSGSTGKPKGVAHSHRSQLHTVMINTNEARLCCQDRLTFLHSVGFTSAQAHLFQSLLNGASLHCFELKSEGIHGLAEWLKQQGITVYHSPPAVFRQLAEAIPAQEQLSSLRLIRLTGAPVNRQDFDLYAQTFAPRPLLQILLNSTEANVISSFVTDGTFCFPENGSPVGYPALDKEVLLLDEDGLEVGPGQVGEICVKSRYLPPGYWDSSEISVIRARSPTDLPAQRMCLTGDLGRVLPDGLLIHLGRKDSMVKIRGYRVELSEIERALQDCPAVKEASVLAWEREPGDKIPVAYVVPSSSPAPTICELQDFLTTKLPDYMAPGCFMFLDSLPLVNGRVDRNALPLPDHQRPELTNPYVQPRNDLEEKIAQIWTGVLTLDRVGIHDNFFDLGGHSLAAMRVVSRLRDILPTKIALIDLFEAPTIAALAARIERDRLSGAAAQMPALRSTRRGQSLALSFGQERLWFLDQLEPESGQHNIVVAYELAGQLDAAALEQSLNEIIKRHESLRTVFPAVDGRPQQVILSALKMVLPVVDLRGTVTEGDPLRAVSRFFEREAQLPFDLALGPLLRATLVRLEDDHFALVLALHHLVFDGWSMDVLARELSLLYGAFVVRQPSPLLSVPVQYADFVIWQRQRLAGAILDDQLAYWREHLTGLPVLRLSTDRPRPRARSGRGGQHWFTLSPTLSQSLKELSREAGGTLFMTLLAAYQTLLSRYTGQEDICVGVPISGRHDSALEETIGFFLNMLVIRTDLSGAPNFVDLLARVRKRCVAAYAHQDLPFERLVEEVQPKRDINRNPLFQVSFTLRNASPVSLQLAGMEVRKLDLNAGTVRFDLELVLEERENGLLGFVAYSADLFDASTIERMVGNLQVLLDGIAADPTCRIADLPLLTEAERHQVVMEWNATQSDYPKYKCMHQLFEEQAERAPGSVAVIFENEQLSYRALNDQANQLAHYLRRQGAGTETRVAVFLKRSTEMVVGLLAVLKAGGAYVPLDPEYPKERLAFMLKDAQAFALLTQRSLLVNLPAQNVRALCLDEHWPEIARESKENLINETTPESLAYVMYTSGSTGKPKGVMISHQALANHMVWMQNALPLTEADRVLQKTPFSFDASIWEFFAPLLAGAKLILAGAQAHRDIPNLVKLIGQQKITILQAVPSMLGAMLDDEGLENCQSLRRVFCGGEVLAVKLAERFAARFSAELYNLYGPTEATIDSTFEIYDHDTNLQGIPIGQPIANVQTYILDPHFQPAAIGAWGELYIAGDGLARGYLNHPELTSEKFIPNPFSKQPGRRLYATGDLCRYLPGGNIEFLGRIDDQVKIRGYRIELGEVEATLGEHPMVREAVAMAREDTPGDRRLVAYVVLTQATSQKVEELRNFLKRKLPEHMIPSALVFLESLPVTPNGKVDRKALPVPDQGRPELKGAFVAPRTPLEKQLARIWGEVLKLEKVGIHDNFFDLGGHSLLATQVNSRIRAALGAEVPLQAMFETPTIAELAVVISEKLGARKMDSILSELESLTDEGAQRLLSDGLEKAAVQNQTDSILASVRSGEVSVKSKH